MRWRHDVTTFLFSTLRLRHIHVKKKKLCCLWDNVVKYCRAGQATDDKIQVIQHMRIACWIPKATDSHNAFPIQQWLHERTSLLHYMYNACLFLNGFLFLDYTEDGSSNNLVNMGTIIPFHLVSFLKILHTSRCTQFSSACFCISSQNSFAFRLLITCKHQAKDD